MGDLGELYNRWMGISKGVTCSFLAAILGPGLALGSNTRLFMLIFWGD